MSGQIKSATRDIFNKKKRKYFVFFASLPQNYLGLITTEKIFLDF